MRKDNENNVVDDTVKIHATTTTTHKYTQTICNINKNKKGKKGKLFFIYLYDIVLLDIDKQKVNKKPNDVQTKQHD